MSDFPVYPQYPVKRAPKPNAFSRFFGHPLCMVLTLTALFSWCLFLIPIVQTIWIFYFCAFPLFLIPFVSCLSSFFRARRIVCAVISIVVFLAIISHVFSIADWYDDLHIRINDSKMREVSEQMFEKYALRLQYTEDGFSCALPEEFRRLSCDGFVRLNRTKQDGEVVLTAAFAQYLGKYGNRYYVYQNKENPDWENDSIETFEQSIHYFSDQFYLLFND